MEQRKFNGDLAGEYARVRQHHHHWTCQRLLVFFCGRGIGGPNNFQELLKNTAVWNSRKLTPCKSMQTMFSDLDIQQYALCLANHASHFFFVEEAQEHQRYVDNSLLNSLSFATQTLFPLKGNLLQCFSIGWTVVRERESMLCDNNDWLKHETPVNTWSETYETP